MSISDILEFNVIDDERGSLLALEQFSEIPFDIKRVYFIYNTQQGVARGFHAHRNLEQVLLCVSGSCTVLLDNGNTRESISLSSPHQGLLIKSMIWREMHQFSIDCVLMVLASNYYIESDYIRDYNQFLKATKCKP